MKNNILYLLILLLGTLTFYSCDDSFLEENKKQLEGYELDVSLFVQPTNQFSEVSITLPDLKNKNFKILQYPKIIHFQSFNGYIDETGKLSFLMKVDEYDNPIRLEPQNLGNIILNVEEFGLLSIKVESVNWGTPKASVRESVIEFDLSRDRKELRIENFANGILFYKLVQKPSWIQIDRTSWANHFINVDEVNYIEPNMPSVFFIVPDVEGLSPGIHEGEIVFETSDPENPVLRINVTIRVRSYENPDTMIPIEGVVVDAEFDKNTNTAFIITKDPAKLISYNVDTKLKKEKILDKSPYSVALTADGKTILLGESGQMEFMEAATMNVKDKIAQPFIVADLIDGENGFYYLANKEGEVFSFNTLSKDVKKQPMSDKWGYESKGNVLLKVKNKQQLALTRSSTSPNGFFLIDASIPDELKLIKYWHESFGKKFLTSEDFEYLFSFSSAIYKFPDENTGNTIYMLGEFNFGPYSGVTWMHHSPITSSIWISYTPYDSNSGSSSENLFEYNDKTFAFKRKIALNEYVTTYNERKDYYKTTANYFFATKEGNKLFLIKNINAHYPSDNAWHIEIIDVSK